MSSDVHLVLVQEPRAPVEVDLFGTYFRRHDAAWRVAARLLDLRIASVAASETAKMAGGVEQLSRCVVWCDLPPLPVNHHEQLCEELWGKGITILPSPQNLSHTWDLSHWYPRLQAAFVRQPPTAIVETRADLSEPAVVSALERTLRAVDTLGDVPKGKGAREILRPWFGWSPLFDLDGMAPWEVSEAASLRRIGPFLIQQQENWDLQIGGIALQFLPPHLPDIPVVRVYVLGGAPVWWSARNRRLRGDMAHVHRLWEIASGEGFAGAINKMTNAISGALGATEFVFEIASVPSPYVVDVRPLNAVLEPNHGAHLAVTICLAAWLRGIALGESAVGALTHIPSWETIVTAIDDAGHRIAGHGPFHVGAAAEVMQPPVEAARGGGTLLRKSSSSSTRSNSAGSGRSDHA